MFTITTNTVCCTPKIITVIQKHHICNSWGWYYKHCQTVFMVSPPCWILSRLWKFWTWLDNKDYYCMMEDSTNFKLCVSFKSSWTQLSAGSLLVNCARMVKCCNSDSLCCKNSKLLNSVSPTGIYMLCNDALHPRFPLSLLLSAVSLLCTSLRSRGS